jgi:hypothetical protein
MKRRIHEAKKTCPARRQTCPRCGRSSNVHLQNCIPTYIGRAISPECKTETVRIGGDLYVYCFIKKADGTWARMLRSWCRSCQFEFRVSLPRYLVIEDQIIQVFRYFGNTRVAWPCALGGKKVGQSYARERKV